MVGVKKFNQESVLDEAMTLFWRKGYGASSIHELEQVTSIGRGSLYNAYGDKEGLFLAALSHYDSKIGSVRLRKLASPDPFQAVEGFLQTLVEQMSDPQRPRGCLHTNTSLECPEAPEAVLRAVADRTTAIENSLYRGFANAQKEGRIDRDVDVRALARFYLGVAKGMAVLHKVAGDSSMLRDIVNVALSKWPGHASKRRRAKKSNHTKASVPVSGDVEA